MAVITYEPTSSQFAYTFGGLNPVREIRPGDVVTVYTEDCFGGAIDTVTDQPSKKRQFPYLNPVTGPFHVTGAEPGDTLAVHFLDISPARDWGISSLYPHFGALVGTHETPMLHRPLYERVWRYDIDTTAGTVTFQARDSDYSIALPLDPMHGTVGVAPPGSQALSTITCGSHGGNLDTPELRAGTTLYLPVNVSGALLGLGDGHARQGQGELTGVAVETAMITTFTVEVIHGFTASTPRLETDDAIMSIGCARPLEDAFRISQHDMVLWLQQLTGLHVLDAYQLVAQAGTAPVGNAVDPNYSMLARIPKTLLQGALPYEGVHERLRAVS
jgi:amidase